jgi:hypothetical protein
MGLFWAVVTAGLFALSAFCFFLKWLDASEQLERLKNRKECPWDDCKALIKTGGLVDSLGRQKEMPCPVCAQMLHWDGYHYFRRIK